MTQRMKDHLLVQPAGVSQTVPLKSGSVPSSAVLSHCRWDSSWGHLLLFSRSVVSDSLWPHGRQHTRLPCPSPSPGVYSNHVHWVSNAIQPSSLLSSPSPPAFNLSQHKGWCLSSRFKVNLTCRKCSSKIVKEKSVSTQSPPDTSPEGL